MQDIYGLFHPDDIDTVRRAVADHLTGVTPQYRCEFRLRSKSGEWIWFANYGRIMDGHSETPGKRLIGVTFNIHDRKCRETEIAQINQQLTEQNRLLQQLNATLERLAANDSLTGLSNRRTLMELGAKRPSAPNASATRCPCWWRTSTCSSPSTTCTATWPATV